MISATYDVNNLKIEISEKIPNQGTNSFWMKSGNKMVTNDLDALSKYRLSQLNFLKENIFKFVSASKRRGIEDGFIAFKAKDFLKCFSNASKNVSKVKMKSPDINETITDPLLDLIENNYKEIYLGDFLEKIINQYINILECQSSELVTASKLLLLSLNDPNSCFANIPKEINLLFISTMINLTCNKNYQVFPDFSSFFSEI